MLYDAASNYGPQRKENHDKVRRWQLYAMNKAVQFMPYVSPLLNLAETSVTEQHWSVRKHKAAMPE
jgi:hypothetical protein